MYIFTYEWKHLPTGKSGISYINEEKVWSEANQNGHSQPWTGDNLWTVAFRLINLWNMNDDYKYILIGMDWSEA